MSRDSSGCALDGSQQAKKTSLRSSYDEKLHRSFSLHAKVSWAAIMGVSLPKSKILTTLPE